MGDDHAQGDLGGYDTRIAVDAPAQAGTTVGGYVTGFVTLDSGVALVFSDGARSGVPGYSNTFYPNRWALNSTTPTGQATLAVLLSARATREPVSFYGTGACEVQGDGETLSAVVTNNVQ